MLTAYVSLVLKLFSLGLMFAAGGLWAGAGVETRPKYRDEQTLVGGAIWSQIIIPIGLLISMIAQDNLNRFIHGYFLISGVVLLVITGVLLVSGEYKSFKRTRQSEHSSSHAHPDRVKNHPYDKIYLTIGLLALFASLLMISDFILLFT